MTDYTYSKVAVYAELGGALRLARNSRSFTTDPVTGLPVNVTQNGFTAPYLDTDSSGIADFTAETPGPIRLTTGATFVDVYSEELPGLALAAPAAAQASADASAASAASAAASASLVGAPADTAVAAIMGNPATASRVVTDGLYTVNRPVNLLERGADNTGATSVSTILAEAASVGRRIDVPPGIYLLGSQFAPTVPIELNCEPGVVFRAGFTETTQLGLIRPAADFTMIGGTIDGMATAAPFGAMFGLCIDSVRALLRDVTIQNTRHHGVYARNTAAATFEHVTIDTCGRVEFSTAAGFYSSGSGDMRWSDCVAKNNHQQGWYVGNPDGSNVQLVNCLATDNGAFGIDTRTPGTTVTGCSATRNNKGGLSVATGYTANNRLVAVTGGTFYNNGPSGLSDAYEVSISNTDFVSLSNLVVESTSLTTAINVASCSRVSFNGVTVNGNHSAFTYGYRLGGTTRTVGVSINGGSINNWPAAGECVIATNVDDLAISGTSFTGGTNDVHFTGTCNNAMLNPGSWLRRVSGASSAAVYSGGRMVVAPHIAGNVSPVSGVWLRGATVDNINAAVAAAKGWTCTVAGAASTGTWAASTAYALGIWYKTSTGKVMEVTTAGTTSTTEPAPTIVGQVVTDGTVTWTCQSLTAATFVSTGNL